MPNKLNQIFFFQGHRAEMVDNPLNSQRMYLQSGMLKYKYEAQENEAFTFKIACLGYFFRF